MSVPIYEYYCPDCEVEFEKLVKLSEANAVQDCPECGGRHTQKKLSTFATSGGSTSKGAAASSCGRRWALLLSGLTISRELIKRNRP